MQVTRIPTFAFIIFTCKLSHHEKNALLFCCFYSGVRHIRTGTNRKRNYYAQPSQFFAGST